MCATAVQVSGSKSHGALRVVRIVAVVLLNIGLLLITLWSAAALYFDVGIPRLRLPLAMVYLLAIVVLWFFVKRRLVARLGTLIGFAGVLTWWLTLAPSNDRN